MSIRFALLLIAVLLPCRSYPCIADDDIVLLVPADQGEVRFGDPLFMPIAIVNQSDHDRRSSILKYDRTLKVEVLPLDGVTPPITAFEGSGYRFRLSPARSVESTVMALDIWNPNISKEFLDGELIRLEVSVPIATGQSKYSDQAATLYEAWDGKTKQVVSTTVRLSGSAFLNRAELLSRRVSVPDDWSETVSAFPNSTFVSSSMYFGWFGPMGWGAERFRNGFDDRDSDHFNVSKTQIAPDSSLARAIKFVELKQKFGHKMTCTVEETSTFIREYRELLKKCAPSECQFHVRSLPHLPIVPLRQKAFLETLRHEFPLELGNIDPTMPVSASTRSLLFKH